MFQTIWGSKQSKRACLIFLFCLGYQSLLRDRIFYGWPHSTVHTPRLRPCSLYLHFTYLCWLKVHRSQADSSILDFWKKPLVRPHSPAGLHLPLHVFVHFRSIHCFANQIYILHGSKNKILIGLSVIYRGFGAPTETNPRENSLVILGHSPLQRPRETSVESLSQIKRTFDWTILSRGTSVRIRPVVAWVIDNCQMMSRDTYNYNTCLTL